MHCSRMQLKSDLSGVSNCLSLNLMAQCRLPGSICSRARDRFADDISIVLSYAGSIALLVTRWKMKQLTNRGIIKIDAFK